MTSHPDIDLPRARSARLQIPRNLKRDLGPGKQSIYSSSGRQDVQNPLELRHSVQPTHEVRRCHVLAMSTSSDMATMMSSNSLMCGLMDRKPDVLDFIPHRGQNNIHACQSLQLASSVVQSSFPRDMTCLISTAGHRGYVDLQDFRLSWCTMVPRSISQCKITINDMDTQPYGHSTQISWSI